MQEILGTKVDTANMTLEELKAARDKARAIKTTYAGNKELLLQLQQILGTINHRILMITLLSHKYSS